MGFNLEKQKILHIWDQAGVASIFAKYLSQSNHNVKILRFPGFDPFEIYNFYNDYVENTSSRNFIKKCITEAKLANIVHVHSQPQILVEIAKKYPNQKKLVLHYHGSDIRGFSSKENIPHKPPISSIFYAPFTYVNHLRKPWKKINNEAQELADLVLVSTEDLLIDVPSAVYLPNPVDTEHFKPISDSENNSKKSLFFHTGLTSVDDALNYCKNHVDISSIDIHDKKKSPLTYSQMPNFLQNYKVFIDIRFINGVLLKSLSKTALESLACGLEVLNYDLKFQTVLPKQHQPSNATSKLISLYSKL